LNPVFSI